MKLLYSTTVILAFIYNGKGSSAAQIDSKDNVFGKNIAHTSETKTSSDNNNVPIRILTDSTESKIKAPKINVSKPSTKQAEAEADNNSNVEIDLLTEIEPTDTSLYLDFNNDVGQRSGFVSTEIEEQNALDHFNHDTDGIDYEADDDDIGMTEDEYLFKKNKLYDDIGPSRRTLAYHGNIDVKGRSGIPEEKSPVTLKWYYPYSPTFYSGYASNGPKRLNRNENIFHSSRFPQYYSMFPAPRMFYIPPSYPRYLPLVTQIRKIDNTEMIIPKVKGNVITSGRSFTIESIFKEETTESIENEVKLNEHESNSYPYEPLPSSVINNNTKNNLENSLIFKKLVMSSMNPKQINVGAKSLYANMHSVPIQNVFQGNHESLYNSSLYSTTANFKEK